MVETLNLYNINTGISDNETGMSRYRDRHMNKAQECLDFPPNKLCLPGTTPAYPKAIQSTKYTT